MTMNSLGNFNPANDPESMVSFYNNRVFVQSDHFLSCKRKLSNNEVAV